MAVNVRKLFRANCGPDVRFLASTFSMRDNHRTVIVTFQRGKRVFKLDQVIHKGATPDERLTNAVLRLAAIAKGLEAVLAQPDGAGTVKVERLLS